jgi:hypothetical protein
MWTEVIDNRDCEDGESLARAYKLGLMNAKEAV